MSRWLFPFERRVLRRRRMRTAILLIAAFLVLHLFDRAIFHALYVGRDALPQLEGKDWYRTLRVAGTLWPWLFIAFAIGFHRLGARPDRREAPRLIAAAALAGLVAEILQVLTGRLRPSATGGLHAHRGLLERFSNSEGVGFPSSHAAVAFGAAFMVAFLYPRAGPIALLAAAGCGLTRLLAGAHFATDIFAAAVVGYAMARLLRPGGWAAGGKGLLLP